VITVTQFVVGLILTAVATAAGFLAYGLSLVHRADDAAAADSSDRVRTVVRGARVILTIDDVDDGHQEVVAMSPDRAFELARNISKAVNAVWRRKDAPTRMGVAKFDMHKQRRRRHEREAAQANEEGQMADGGFSQEAAIEAREASATNGGT